ncbi:MAG: hypothetical protein AMXMBFR57_03240 [Acidimicrobiia bacterium]|jgi:uncharacterized membrane protein
MTRVFLVWIHVLAATAWVGGMVTFVALLMPWVRRGTGACGEERRARMRAFGHDFRRYAWVCLWTLLATGSALWWSARPAGHAGTLLLVKAALWLTAILLNACESRIVSRPVARWAGRASLCVGVAALAVAVILVRHAW